MQDSKKPPECDIIMKGGITSAIVYPAAIDALQQHYRFRGIGGASAGAIAAAAAACAEVGRADDGFGKLRSVQDETEAPDFLTRRFVPSRQLAPLFAGFRAYLDWRPRHDRGGEASRRPWYKARFFERWWLRFRKLGDVLVSAVQLSSVLFRAQRLVTGGLTLLGGLSALFLTDALNFSRWPVTFSVTALCVGGLLGAALSIVRLAWLVVRLNDKESAFGICPGSEGTAGCTSKRLAQIEAIKKEAGSEHPSERLHLTDWLHVRLNGMANLRFDKPSPTFKDLKRAKLDVKLMTTDLSNELPMLLPSSWGARSFFYREEEFGRFFPEPILTQLRIWNHDDEEERVAKGKSPLKFPKGERLYRLPLGDDLPLLVAVRLSLSFPVLLSAIRLYSFKDESSFTGTKEVDLDQQVEEHWFSDGGIGSNFPIHVFDSWLPSRPTFGITLYDASSSEREDGAFVQLPAASGADRAKPRRVIINGLFGFLTSVFETAKNFRDTLQSCLPSYRERIVQVFLEANEGGLNLTMGKTEVKKIKGKGAAAGAALIEQYVTKSGFEQHQWVRLRVLLNALDEELASLTPDSRDYLKLVEQAKESDWYLKPKSDEEAKNLSTQIEVLSKLINEWKPSGCEAPKPSGHLRVTPDL